MAVSLTRFHWWLWSKKEKEKSSNGSTLSSDWSGFGAKKISAQKKVKRKWHSREERRIEKSDAGVCISGSESDGPDWSIGWVEPHGTGFGSDDETDDGFAVLVPCYKPGCKELVEGSNNQLLSALKNLPNEFSSGNGDSSFYGKGKNCMEWLSSIRNF